jgi:acyl-CoA thioesterase YciA
MSQKSELERVKDGELILRGCKICMTRDIGAHQNMFGGNLLSMIDEVAAVFASEICDSPLMVTKSLEVIFEKPVKVDKIIKAYCGIVSMGNTSLTLKVDLKKYNVHTEEEIVVCSAKTTFVKVDEEGMPIPISDRIKQKFGFLKA